MRVGLYARVSTHDQHTLSLQREAMQAYATARSWTIVMHVEDIRSGVSERPQRDALLHAARRRERCREQDATRKHRRPAGAREPPFVEARDVDAGRCKYIESQDEGQELSSKILRDSARRGGWCATRRGVRRVEHGEPQAVAERSDST